MRQPGRFEVVVEEVRPAQCGSRAAASMIDVAICNGDTVVVRQADTADHNDIVAAVLDGEATVKRLRREDGHVWLMPHNPVSAHISGDHAAILGKVVAVLRTP